MGTQYELFLMEYEKVYREKNLSTPHAFTQGSTLCIYAYWFESTLQTNKILSDVCSCFGRVVAEAIVSESRLLVEVLSLMEKGMKSTSHHRAYPPIDAQLSCT